MSTYSYSQLYPSALAAAAEALLALKCVRLLECDEETIEEAETCFNAAIALADLCCPLNHDNVLCRRHVAYLLNFDEPGQWDIERVRYYERRRIIPRLRKMIRTPYEHERDRTAAATTWG